MRRAIATVIAVVAINLYLAVGAVSALANHEEPGQSGGKVYVCKYVGQPGVDEELQTGQNPIEVSVNALEGDGFAGAACPAELAPPTMYTSSPRHSEASDTEAP